MADRIVTIASSGGDYSSLNAAITGEDDFQAGEDNIIFRYTEAFEDTTAVEVTGFTTSTDHRVIIEADESVMHDGTRGSGARIITANYTSIINISIPYVEIYRIEFNNTTGVVSGVYNSGGYGVIDSCLFYGCYDNISLASQYNVVANSISYTSERDGIVSQNANNRLYNCVILNSARYGVYTQHYGNEYYTNIYSGGSSTADIYAPNTTPTITTCASSDGSQSTTTIALADCDFTSYTSGSENAEIGRGSSLIGVGTDLSSDPVYAITTDMFGKPVSSTPDIGAVQTYDRVVEIASSGGDYISLNSAVSGEDDIRPGEYIYFRYTENFADTTAVTVSGFDTGVNRRIIIEADESVIHNGTRGSGARIVGSVTWGDFITFSDDYVEIYRMEVSNTSGTNGGNGIYISGDYCVVDGCLVYDGYDNIYISGEYCIVANSVSYSAVYRNFYLQLGNYCYFYNCTSLNAGETGIRVYGYGRELTCVNCYSGGSTTADFLESTDSSLTVTTCTSSDGSESTTQIALDDCEFTSYTSSSENAEIGRSSGLIGIGTDLSSDSVYPVTTDMFGKPVSTTPDIGAVQTYNRIIEIASTGGDYTSLNSAVTGEDDLRPSEYIIFRAVDAFEDTAYVDVGSFNQTANHRIVIEADEDNWAGTSYNTNKYRLTYNSWETLLSLGSYTIVRGIQLRKTGVSSVISFAGYNIIDSCLAITTSTGGCFNGDSSADETVIVNCIAIGGGGFSLNNSQTVYVYNCTAINQSSYGFRLAQYETQILRNCYAGNAGTSDYYDPSSSLHTWDNCHSSDGSGTTTTTACSTTSGAYFTNVTSGNEDVEISRNSDFIGMGSDLSGDSIYPVSIDICGKPRPSTPDIGAIQTYDRIVEIASSGGDYASLNSAVTGEDDIRPGEYIYFRYTENFADTNAVTISDFDTGVNRRIIIEADESVMHDGTRGSGARISTSTAFSANVLIQIAYTEVYNLEVTNSSSSGMGGFYVSAGNCLIANCLIYGILRVHSSSGGVRMASSGNSCRCINTIVYSSYQGFTAMDGELDVLNCTSLNATLYGYYVNGYDSMIMKNCYAGGSGTADIYTNEGLGNLTVVTSYTSDGSESTTQTALADCDFTSYSSGSEDAHIGADSDLIGIGTDLSSDSVYPFNYDFEGDTRSSWDIGADEYVSSGTIEFTGNHSPGYSHAGAITGDFILMPVSISITCHAYVPDEETPTTEAEIAQLVSMDITVHQS